MANILIASGFGLLGGLIRASVGLLKLKKIKKEFNIKYLLVTLVLSAIIGAFIAMAYSTNNIFYLAAGYAGTDILQGLAKAGKK